MLALYVRAQNLVQRLRDDSGQGMVEYGLIIGLVGVGLVVALVTMKDQLGIIFDNITCELTKAVGGTC